MSDDKIYFSTKINERERACFETGIKLGALYHILCGMPISSDPLILDSVERGIEASISCQPYVKSVKINLNRDVIKGDKKTEFSYDEITGMIIQAELIVEYESTEIIAKIKWIEEMEYPLMFIEDIRKKS